MSHRAPTPLVMLAALAGACGRLGFDPTADDRVVLDGGRLDAAGGPPALVALSLDDAAVTGDAFASIGALTLPARPGSDWLVFVTASLSSTAKQSDANPASELRYSVDGLELARSGSQNIGGLGGGPFMHTAVVPASERDLDLRVELRDGAGATTTARDLRVAAIATPADAVHHAYGAGPFDFDAASPASVLVATPAAATAPHLGLGALVAHQRDSSGNLSVDWLLGAPLLAELPQRTPRTAPQTYFAVRAIPASETAPLTLTANVTTQTIGRARAVSLIAAPYAAFGAIALRTASVDQQLAAGAEADVTTWTVPADVGGPALVLLGISASQPCPSTPSRRAIRFTIGGSEAATFAHDIDSCIYRVPYGTVAVVPDAAGLTLTTRVDAALSPLDVGDDFALVLTPR